MPGTNESRLYGNLEARTSDLVLSFRQLFIFPLPARALMPARHRVRASDYLFDRRRSAVSSKFGKITAGINSGPVRFRRCKILAASEGLEPPTPSLGQTDTGLNSGSKRRF